jgi:hypothetical protein
MAGEDDRIGEAVSPFRRHETSRKIRAQAQQVKEVLGRFIGMRI